MTAVVFFDVAGTLIRVRDGVGAQYAGVAARFGVVADPKALERNSRASAPLRRWRSPARGPRPCRTEREIWRGSCAMPSPAPGTSRAFAPGAFDAYFDAVYRHFEEPATWDVFPDVVPALSALRDDRCAARHRQQLRQPVS